MREAYSSWYWPSSQVVHGSRPSLENVPGRHWAAKVDHAWKIFCLSVTVKLLKITNKWLMNKCNQLAQFALLSFPRYPFTDHHEWDYEQLVV